MLFPHLNQKSSAVFLKNLLANGDLLSKCQCLLPPFRVYPVMPVGGWTEQPESEPTQAQQYL